MGSLRNLNKKESLTKEGCLYIGIGLLLLGGIFVGLDIMFSRAPLWELLQSDITFLALLFAWMVLNLTNIKDENVLGNNWLPLAICLVLGILTWTVLSVSAALFTIVLVSSEVKRYYFSLIDYFSIGSTMGLLIIFLTQGLPSKEPLVIFLLLVSILLQGNVMRFINTKERITKAKNKFFETLVNTVNLLGEYRRFS